VHVRDYLESNDRSWPDRLAYVSRSGRFTWGATADRVRRLAGALQDLGVEKGDVVATLSLDIQEVVETWLASCTIGAVRAGINYRYAPREMAHIINDAGVKVLIVQDECEASYRAISDLLPTVTAVVGVGKHAFDLDYDELLRTRDDPPSPVELHDGDAVALSYTTGSTGVPKGAVWSQRSVVTALMNTMLQAGMRRDDVFMHCLPAAGVPILSTSWNVFNGSTVVLMDKFSPRSALELIQAERVTSVLWVPTMLMDVLADPEIDSFDVSSLRLVIYGSAPTTPALVRHAIDRFGCEIQQWYGSTEAAGGFFTMLHHDDHLLALDDRPELLTSCGRPTLHARIVVVDPAGAEVPVGEVGEICVQSGAVMNGYLNLDEESAATLQHGWLHTGDLGRRDADGYLYLVDRKKFMIITGAYNVYPVVVENAIAEHPLVREVCVVGIPDERWGEAVCAVVVREADLTEEDVVSFCQERLAKFEVPKRVDFVDALPRGATGKVLKREVHDRYREPVASSPVPRS
jgi:acyl-CoA synthetase (AMP-forming)/AMP-acid ligase II